MHLPNSIPSHDTFNCFFSALNPAEEWVEEDFGHGRIGNRKCSIYRDFFIYRKCLTVERLESYRYIKSESKEETETCYYITGSGGSAEKSSKAIRSHWGIENTLHWVLDVSFQGDDSWKREGYSAQNFSMINRIALNLIKNEPSKKRSVKGKRLNAGWNNDYLLKILMN